MAQSVVINGVTYADVPEVDIPLSGGGTAKFMDTSDGTASAAKMLKDETAYVNGNKITGSIESLGATTYTPGTSDQTIAAGKYLSGAQTISGSEYLVASNIKSGVTIFGVQGTLALPSISQDGTTKILSIA